jgi:hypothetical protein
MLVSNNLFTFWWRFVMPAQQLNVVFSFPKSLIFQASLFHKTIKRENGLFGISLSEYIQSAHHTKTKEPAE